EGYSWRLAFCQPCPFPQSRTVQLPSMAPFGSNFSAVLEAVAHAPTLFRARLVAPSGSLRCVQSPCASEVVKEAGPAAGATLGCDCVSALLTVHVRRASTPRTMVKPRSPYRP